MLTGFHERQLVRCGLGAALLPEVYSGRLLSLEDPDARDAAPHPRHQT